MNCPKCNSPLNEGDKFCQVCGSLIEGGATPSPEVAPAPVVNQAAPMPQAAPVDNQMPSQPGPMGPPPMPPQGENKKSSNVILYVLVVVIVILVVAIVLLVASSNSSESSSSSTEESSSTSESTTTEVTTTTYNEVTVDGYKFELPSGYGVEDVDGLPAFYDYSDTVFAYVDSSTGSVNNLISQVEEAKVILQSGGMTNVTSETKNLNNKSAIIFSGEYGGYYLDIIYVQNGTTVICSEVYYYDSSSKTNNQTTVLDIASRITISATSYGSDTNLLNFDMSEILSSE